MILYVNQVTKKVIFVTDLYSSFLQSLEGSQLDIVEISLCPAEFTPALCMKWKFQDHMLSQDAIPARESDIILAKKAELLLMVHKKVEQVRRPYVKTLSGQDQVYDMKHDEACRFLAGEPVDTLLHLQDEIDILKRPPRTVALEIKRQRSERDWIFRCSERARRSLVEKLCAATELNELIRIAALITDRNFKLLIEV